MSRKRSRSYGSSVSTASRSRRTTTWVVDAGIALGFSLVALVTVLAGVDDGYAGTAPVWQSAVVAAVAPLPLVLRRRAPVLALALVVVLRGLPQLVADLDRPFFGGLVLVVVAFASCAQYARPPWPWLGVVFPAGLYALYAVLDPAFRAPSEWVFELALFALGWTIGIVLRVLADRNAALERELAAVATAERLRQASRIAAEREHIARELHDVIAHSVTAMIVQAGSARLQLAAQPASSAAALRTVESTGREALADLRTALGLLRAEPASDLDPASA